MNFFKVINEIKALCSDFIKNNYESLFYTQWAIRVKERNENYFMIDFRNFNIGIYLCEETNKIKFTAEFKDDEKIEIEKLSGEVTKLARQIVKIVEES